MHLGNLLFWLFLCFTFGYSIILPIFIVAIRHSRMTKGNEHPFYRSKDGVSLLSFIVSLKNKEFVVRHLLNVLFDNPLKTAYSVV